MERMVLEFAHSEKLQRHVQFLYSAGGMYLRCNGNLLYHGCIPTDENGIFCNIADMTDLSASYNKLRKFPNIFKEAKSVIDNIDLLKG